MLNLCFLKCGKPKAINHPQCSTEMGGIYHPKFEGFGFGFDHISILHDFASRKLVFFAFLETMKPRKTLTVPKDATSLDFMHEQKRLALQVRWVSTGKGSTC